MSHLPADIHRRLEGSDCGLTECRGKPRCPQCIAMFGGGSAGPGVERLYLHLLSLLGAASHEDAAAEIGRLHGAALKAAAEPAQPVAQFDLVQHLRRQAAFSERTFGPGDRTAGVCDHIRKELREVEADAAAGVPTLAEWIDVIILAFDGAWRSGATPEQIVVALVAKQTKNEGRRWPDWRTADPTKAIEHDRSADLEPSHG